MKKDKTPNRYLWQARQRSGLSPKTVAFLLGRKFADETSRYEAGQVPTLPTALKLEIIYRVPVRLLFYPTFQNCLWQVRDRSSKFGETSSAAALFAGDSLAARLEKEDYCTYAELLQTPNLPPVEKQRIYGHIRYLAKEMNKAEGIEAA